MNEKNTPWGPLTLFPFLKALRHEHICSASCLEPPNISSFEVYGPLPNETL